MKKSEQRTNSMAKSGSRKYCWKRFGTMKEDSIVNLKVEIGYNNMIPPTKVSARKCIIVAMRKVFRMTSIKS